MILANKSQTTGMLLRLVLASCTVLMVLLSCHKDQAATPPVDPDPTDSTDTVDTVAVPVELRSRVLLDNLSYPWDIFYGPDGHVWMTEKAGKISRVDPSNAEVKTLITIADVKVRGEGGLLGMALSVPIDGVSFLFVAYNYEDGADYKQKIVRYNYDYAENTLSDPRIIHDNVAAAGIHNGCRLVITPDGKLLATTGDASNTSLPQNFSSKNGKSLRINFDGSIPSDNPDPSSTVWSIGHRNAQGLVFARDSLYSSEHGPDTDDEVNMIHRGGNYGWPDVRGTCEDDENAFCEENQVIEPLANWTPTIAVSGMEYYDSDSIPQWKNSLLVCTLKDETLYQLKLNASGSQITEEKTFFRSDYGRLRDVCAAPNGKVYLCTSNGSGDMLIEIEPK
jgi:glucose/arabinose dehydrogenase